MWYYHIKMSSVLSCTFSNYTYEQWLKTNITAAILGGIIFTSLQRFYSNEGGAQMWQFGGEHSETEPEKLDLMFEKLLWNLLLFPAY